MSDISISAMTPQTILMDNAASVPESIKNTTSEIESGVNQGGLDRMEMAVAGVEVASRTEDFFGASADFSSTGTDRDIQQAVATSLAEGIGTITDTIA